MAKIFEFPEIKKIKPKNDASIGKNIDAGADYAWRLPSKQEEHEFILKVTWVVDIIHKLKKANRQDVNEKNVQIRRELVRGSSPDELAEVIMKADESKIKLHPAYYDAVTDEIMERKLHKSRR